MNDYTALEPGVDGAAVDAVLTASRSLIAVATRSLGGLIRRHRARGDRRAVLPAITATGQRSRSARPVPSVRAGLRQRA